MTYVFIHDRYFIQEIALKIDVQLNTIVQFPTIPNPKMNAYVNHCYKEVVKLGTNINAAWWRAHLSSLQIRCQEQL